MSDTVAQVPLECQTAVYFFRFLNLFTFALIFAISICNFDVDAIEYGIMMLLLSLFLGYSDLVDNSFATKYFGFIVTFIGRGITLLFLGILNPQTSYFRNDDALAILLIVTGSLFILASLVSISFKTLVFPAPIPFQVKIQIMSPTEDRGTTMAEEEPLLDP